MIRRWNRQGKSSSSTAAVRRAAIEALEARQMLSVVQEGGLVRVTGTSGDDTIIISRDQYLKRTLRISVNGFMNVVGEKGLSGISVEGLDGNDQIVVDESLGAIGTPINMQGGNGNDSLSGGSGADVISGGPGNDMMRGGAGSDQMSGDAGSDRILGGAGKDIMLGGSGADQLYTSGQRFDVVNAGGDAGDQVDTSVHQYKHAAFNGTVSGYSPQQLRAAYGFGDLSNAGFTNRGAGQTVAIVDAFDAPTIKNDLAFYSSHFGLPAPNKSNLQVYWTGKHRPSVDFGWAGETALDIQMVHAIAPEAKIILVESQNPDDLFNAVQKAIDLLQPTGGVVSMSFTQDEFFATNEDAMFAAAPPNVSFIAAAGDAGAQVNYPAVSPFVTGIGGTFIPLDSSGNLTGPETGWSGSGGGLSILTGRPLFQANATIGGVPWGDHRAVPDIGFNADPASGVAIYNTTPDQFGDTGWPFSQNPPVGGIGGTSEGSPAIAAMIALVNQQRAALGKDPIGNGLNAAIYRAAKNDYANNFNDITSGTNGYSAVQGYDLVTGWGTPQADTLINTLAADNLSGTTNLLFQGAKFISETFTNGGPQRREFFGGSGAAAANGNGNFDIEMIPNASSGVSMTLPSELVDNGEGFFTADGQTSIQVDNKTTVNMLVRYIARNVRRNHTDHLVGEFFAISKRGKIILKGDTAAFRGTFNT